MIEMGAKFFLLIAIILTSCNAFAGGLGLTYAEFENEWSNGYREVFPGELGAIHVGRSSREYIQYDSGSASKSFGNPKRVGDISGNPGFMVSGKSETPTASEFFKVVKKLFPKKYTLVAAYKKDQTALTEMYVFSSSSLAKLPGIRDVYSYQDILGFKGAPVGSFVLFVNYEPGTPNRVGNFLLTLGQGDEGLKRIRKNPF